jgi:hypothetical protein
VNSDVTSQLLIRYSAVVRYGILKWRYNGTVQQLFIDLNTAYDSEVRGLYRFLIEFAVSNKQLTLIQVVVKFMWIVVSSDIFPLQNRSEKEKMFYRSYF